MTAYLIDFWDKPIVRVWCDEFDGIRMSTETRNMVVKSNKGKDNFNMMTTKVTFTDDAVALQFYLTFRDTLIYEPADLPPRGY